MVNEPQETSESNETPMKRRSYLAWVGVAGMGVGIGGLSTGKLHSNQSAADSSPSIQATESGKGDYKFEILVGVKQDIDNVEEAIGNHLPNKAEIVHQNSDLSYVTVRVPDQMSDKGRDNLILALRQKEGIRYAEQNSKLRLSYNPSDPEFPDQTAAKMVNADDAWDVTTGSSDVTIAFLDQGIMYDHPDLQGNMDNSVSNYGKDFVNDDSDPYPEDSSDEFHGTHVAGIAAAEINNNEGIAGISQSSILSGRVANENHEAIASDVADGVAWATNNGADVINISLGGDPNTALKDAVEYAYRNGVLLVAAAGNGSGGAVDYPAAYDECVAVSALAPNGNLAGFSSVGSEVELAAPGMAVVSTTSTDGYGMYSGTSMAAPVVSGVAALALSRWALTNDELRKHLKQTAVDVGLATQEQGYGRVDAYKAVSTSPDTTIVDDFEDENLSEYDFTTGGSGASVVSSPTYSGSYGLELSGTTTKILSTSGLSIYPSAGDVFSYWVRLENGTENTNFTYGVQDDNNRYYLKLNGSDDSLRLFKKENGSSTSLTGDDGVGVSAATWYEIEVNWRTDGEHIITLYDGAGNQHKQISVSDETWTEGGIGYDSYLSSGESVYFDYVTIKSTSSLDGNTIIEDFEDGDFEEYVFMEGSSNAAVVNTPTHEGSYALELADSIVGMNSTTGLSAYPSAGDTFSYWMRLENGTENGNFTYGVQDDNNRYYVKLNGSEDSIRLFLYENGSGTALTGEAGIGLSADTWYEIEIDWRTNGDHIITLTDDSGSVLSQLVSSETTWTDGGIGFDSYLSSGEAIYFDNVTMASKGNTDSDISLIDGFEDGDLSEYANTDSSNWEVQDSFAYDGAYAAANSSNFDAIYNNSYTYSRGEELELRAYLETQNGVSTGIETWFCTNGDASEKYVHYVSAEDNKHSLTYRNSINQKVIDSTTVEIPADEWLRLKVISDDTTVTARLYDSSGNLLSSLSGTDTNLSSGGYGFKDEWRKEGPTVYVDMIRG